MIGYDEPTNPNLPVITPEVRCMIGIFLGGSKLIPPHVRLVFGSLGKDAFHSQMITDVKIYFHMCLGLNSHYFHIIGDGHQPNNRVLYTNYKDSY